MSGPSRPLVKGQCHSAAECSGQCCHSIDMSEGDDDPKVEYGLLSGRHVHGSSHIHHAETPVAVQPAASVLRFGLLPIATCGLTASLDTRDVFLQMRANFEERRDPCTISGGATAFIRGYRPGCVSPGAEVVSDVGATFQTIRTHTLPTLRAGLMLEATGTGDGDLTLICTQ